MSGYFDAIILYVIGTPLYYIPPPRDAIDATYRVVTDDLHSFKVHSTSGVLFLSRPVDAEQSYQTFVEVSESFHLCFYNFHFGFCW